MILFTGGGAVYEAFKKVQDCTRLSLRSEIDEVLANAISKARVIVHNAANIQCQTVEQAVADNFLPTLRLTSLCLTHNPGVHFIYLGSMSYLATADSALPPEQMSPYAYSKYLGETFCLKCAIPRVHALRFSTLFYEDPGRDGLSFLIAAAVRNKAVTTFNGGSAKRDFIPLDIAVEYLWQVIQQPPAHKVINIAANRETSFSEIVRFLKLKIPDLQVSDRVVPEEKQVLSDFSGSSLEPRERILFSLEERMERYMQKVANQA